MKTIVCLLLLLPAYGLRADPISEVRANLERFQGQDLVKGRVEVSTWNRSGEGKKSKERHSSGQVQVEDGPQGLRLGWTAQQILAARRDAQAKAGNPEAATPNLETLKALDAAEAAHLLSYADSLSLKLQGGQLLEDRADAFQGRPARLLVIKPEVRFSAEDREMIKSVEGQLKVWLGADGIPVGLEETVAFKGSKFLISFKGSRAETVVLGRAGNRLVALRSTRETSGSGMGMTNQGRVVTALALN